MPAPIKVEKLNELKQVLEENENFIVSTYSGLNVVKMTELRRIVRDNGSRMKVVKNTLFKQALRESDKHSIVAEKMAEQLKGPVAVTFAGDDFPAVTKAVLEFAKGGEAVKIKSGFFDGQFLPAQEVIQIATLPSREELLGVIGRGLNSPATKVATGVNEVIAKLARAIKAVGEKNG